MRLTLIGSEPPLFRLENNRLWTVQIEPIPGERGRFRAISETRFQCAAPCNHAFSRTAEKAKDIGTICPLCGEPADPVQYLVNVLEPNGNPRCSCESYTTNRGQKTCKHGIAALYLFGKLEAAKVAERQDGP